VEGLVERVMTIKSWSNVSVVSASRGEGAAVVVNQQTNGGGAARTPDARQPAEGDDGTSMP
jgi:hypothetical protein